MKLHGFVKKLRTWIWSRIMLLQRGMTLGVRVIASNDDGEVLMVRHGYTPGWHLPGGGVDYHETMEQAAHRELEEETGYRAEGTLTFLGNYYNRHQWKGDHVALFAAGALTQVRQVEPTYEIKEVGFFPLNALPEGTTQATRVRLTEWQSGCGPGSTTPEPYWS